jgi:hypothetical protein
MFLSACFIEKCFNLLLFCFILAGDDEDVKHKANKVCGKLSIKDK